MEKERMPFGERLFRAFIIIVIVALAFLFYVTLFTNKVHGQSYIGKSYYGVVQDMKTTFKPQIKNYVEETATDGSKNLVVYFNNKQISSYAFDLQKRCIFYLVIMPDTSGHLIYTKYLDGKYVRESPEKWLELRAGGSIVFRFVKSTDNLRSVLFVYPLSVEKEITELIESSQ